MMLTASALMLCYFHALAAAIVATGVAAGSLLSSCVSGAVTDHTMAAAGVAETVGMLLLKGTFCCSCCVPGVLQNMRGTSCLVVAWQTGGHVSASSNSNAEVPKRAWSLPAGLLWRQL